MEGNTMSIKTEKGIAVGQPLSDIQEYNNQLALNTAKMQEQTKVLKLIIIIFGVPVIILTATFLWLIYYVMTNNVLNNIVARCFC
jgi:uncharacterized membrane protein